MAAAGRHPGQDDEPAGRQDPARGDHQRARPGGREVHPLAGRRAGLQGLPRLPRLDLRLAELDDRARHPGPLQARPRRHPLDRHRRRPRRLGGRRRPDLPGRTGHARRRASCCTITEESLLAAVEQCRAGNRLGDVSHAVQQHVEAAGFSIVRSLVGHGIGREHARGPADPQLRRSGHRRPARGGDGAGGRADGHRRAATRSGSATTTGRSTLRTGRWRPTSSSRSPSPPTGPRILTPWHEAMARAAAAAAAPERRRRLNVLTSPGALCSAIVCAACRSSAR